METDRADDSRKRRKFRPTISSYCRGVGMGLWLLITSTLGVVFFHFVPYLFVILFMNPSLYRWLADEMIGSWLIYCVALLEYVLGLKVVITGEKIRPGERCLFIMNHRTRLDWMYFWSVLVRQSSVKTEKIILKSPLKKLPGAGWAMQVGAFIFIDRNWESDKRVLSKMMNYFSDLDHKTQVLLFPEGTDLTSRTRLRSNEFAEKHGWEPYEHCLHPRTTGFIYLTQLMRQNNHIDAVYDVSVAYPYNFPQTEPQLLTGNVPKEVHFNIQRHSIDSLPTDDEGLQKWCQKCWQVKEKLLCQFHKDKKFPQTPDPPEAGDRSEGHKVKPEVMLWLALVYWTLFIIGISIILCYSSLARWLSVVQVIFYLYMGHRYGGFEIFQVDYYNWFFNSKKKVKKIE